ncbi:MAG: AraC family transcriptional regulator [Spirochaetia bacterium]
MRKKKFLLTMLGFLFLTMVLLSLLQFSIFYTGFLNQGLDILHTYNSKVFESVSSSIDFAHDNYTSLAVNMFVMNDIQAALYAEFLDYQQISQTRNIVENIRNFYPEIHSVYLYNKKIDGFYTFYSGVSKLMQPAENFPDPEIKRMLYSGESARKLMPISRMIPRNLSFPEGGKIQVFTYIMFEKPNSAASANGAVVVNIQADHIVNLIRRTGEEGEPLVSDGTELCIAGMDGRIISGTEDNINRAAIKRIIDKAETNGFAPFTERLHGDKMIVSVVRKNQTGWYLISLVPAQNISRSLNPGRLFLFISSLLLIPVLLIIALLLAKKFYYPINELIQTVEQETGNDTDADAVEGELEFLLHSFKSTVEKSRSLEQFRNDHLISVRNEYLSGLLEGRTDVNEHTSDIFREYGVELDPEEPAIIVLFYIYKYQQFLSNIILPFSLGKMIQNHLEGIGPCCCAVLKENSIAVIMNCSIEVEQDLLHGSISGVVDCLNDEASVSVTAAVGDRQESLESISDAYTAAAEILSYRFKKVPGAVLTADDLPSDQLKSYRFPVQEEEKILESVKRENLETALKEYGNFSDRLRDTMAENIILSMTRLASSVFDTIRMIEANSTLRFNHNFAEFSEGLSSCETFPEFNNLFEGLFSSVIREMTDAKSSHTAYKIAEAKKFILTNYRDCGICTESIAQELSISPVYFRRIFKSATGQSVAEFLDQVRIESLKELLLNTTKPIKSLLEEIGVANQRYFIKKFKRTVGVNPQDYRQSRKSPVS